MRIKIEHVPQEEIDELHEASDAGLLKEGDLADLKNGLLKAQEIALSDQVVEFAAKELDMTPEEFVAYLLKEVGATQ